MKKFFGVFFKTVTMYTLYNVIIAFVYELIKYLNISFLGFLKSFLGVFVTIFSFVMIPLMPIIFGLCIYYFVRVLFYGDKAEAYKSMFINIFCFSCMVYFFTVAVSGLNVG